jgi:hypothetical protein
VAELAGGRGAPPERHGDVTPLRRRGGPSPAGG